MNNYICKAKCLKTGKWIQGYYISKVDPLYNITNHYIVYQQRDKNGMLDSFMTLWSIDSDTLCRHIGYIDNHGTPIFENDIVEFKVADTSYKYLIWWNRESNMMTAVPLDGIRFNGFDYYNNFYRSYEEFCLMLMNVYGDYRSIKVIGNIFDNPELMENVTMLDWSSIEDGEF